MRNFLFTIAIFLASTCASWADSLTYTVVGYGGLSSPIAGVSTNSFWWAGWGGTSLPSVSGTVLTSYGFDPLSATVRGITPAPYAENEVFSGSLLLSNSFTVNGTQGITTTFGGLSAQAFGYETFDFALLLKDSQMAAILGITSPMLPFGIDDEPHPGSNFTSVTPGVQTTVNYQFASYPAGFQLGNMQFGCYNQGSQNWAGPCQSEITSTYMPAAGTYQLLFGNFSKTTATSAIAVKSVTVPEENAPADILLICAALSILLICRGREWKRSMKSA